MHAWYSTELTQRTGCAMYRNEQGKPTAVSIVHKDKEQGEQYIREHMPHITDWTYIGVVHEFITESRPSIREQEWEHYKDLNPLPVDQSRIATY